MCIPAGSPVNFKNLGLSPSDVAILEALAGDMPRLARLTAGITPPDIRSAVLISEKNRLI
jgi:hypothetical protein